MTDPNRPAPEPESSPDRGPYWWVGTNYPGVGPVGAVLVGVILLVAALFIGADLLGKIRRGAPDLGTAIAVGSGIILVFGGLGVLGVRMGVVRYRWERDPRHTPDS